MLVQQRDKMCHQSVLHDLLRATSVDGVHVVNVTPKKERHWISDDCDVRISKEYVETKKHDVVYNFLLTGGN